MCQYVFYFFFNDTATTEIYTLTLHDALPICSAARTSSACWGFGTSTVLGTLAPAGKAAATSSCPRVEDRKSTRLNSSHANILYAVFCFKKKTFLTVHLFIPPFCLAFPFFSPT